MSELSGSAAVGIETVEWLDGGSGNLIVRVTGRWRRRRPASPAQVTLVIEREGRRHRFPAMPEPPSLDGAGPGMWRLSFAVPGSLAPALGGHLWLAFGTVTVPLPAPDAAERISAPPRNGQPGPIESSHPRDAGPPVEQVTELERQLADTRADRDQLAASLAEGERTRRVAEQRAHAEQALRRDLARRLTSHERESERARETMGELAAAEDRIRTLERQLRDARRREAEAEQQAAAAVARGRQATEPRPPAPGRPPFGGDREAEQLRFERRLQSCLAEAHARVPVEPTRPIPPPRPEPAALPASGSEPVGPPPSGPEPAALPASRPEVAALPASALVDTLRRELDARAAGEAALRSRLVAAETRLAARVLLDQRTGEVLRQLGTELEGLRVALEDERSRRRSAERRVAELEAERGAEAQAGRRRADRLEHELAGQRQRVRDAYDAIEELRGVLGQPAAPGAREEGGGPPASGGPVQVDRLSDARTRLRASVAPPPAAPGATASPAAGGRTLETAFRRLVKRDAAVAGELLLDLLVLQRVAYPHPVAYDLVLGPGRGCVQVTVGEGPPRIERDGAARTREEVDFQVRGEPARIARLLCAHGIWRRVGLRVARVRGRRDGLVALGALLSLALDPIALRDAGALRRGEAVLGLAAAMVDPAWTTGETFVLAHRDGDGAVTYLIVGDGRRLTVTRTAPAGRVATTIDGPADILVTALSGAEVPAGHLSGDEGPLQSLRAWIKRAQRA